MHKKAIISVFDIACICMFAVFLMALVPSQAHAYVDPSVMTYTIQALAGVVVALSAVFGVMWRRARRLLFKVFKIDESAGKQVEPNVHRIDPVEKKAIDEIASSPDSYGTQLRSFSSNKAPALRLRSRVVQAAIASLLFVFTLLVTAPVELVVASQGSLIFGISSIWPALAVGALIIFLVMTVILSIIRGRAFDIAIGTITALGVCCFVQVIAMNSALPVADGTRVEWGSYKTITLISACVWIVVIAVAVVLCIKKVKISRVALPVLSLVLVLSQVVGLVGVVSTAQDPKKELTMTNEGIFDLSTKSNVVEFVLDTADTRRTLWIMERYPEYFAPFTGFTFFTDVTGSLIPTRYGVPFLLTGELPKEDETFANFIGRRYKDSDYLDDIYNSGRSIGIYTDSLNDLQMINADEMTLYASDDVGIDQVADKTINISMGSNALKGNSVINTVLELWKCAMYRDMPWALKPYFWFYTDEINVASVENSYSNSPYMMNDAAFYNSLKEQRITLNDNSEGAYRFIHLLGAHFPYNMNENCELVGEENSSRMQQTLGCFKLVAEYLDQMKQLGIYDDATIIITADHGKWYLEPDQLDQVTSPIVMVKPPESAEEANEPMKISKTPITHGQVLPTVIDAMGLDASKYGNTVFDESADNNVRYYYMTTTREKLDQEIKEYAITGDTLDFSNWHLTGKEWKVRNQ